MAGFSTYLANAVLAHVTGKTAYTMPTVYIALTTTVPTDATAGTEVTTAAYTGYTRSASTAAAWGTAASGAISNSAATISFPTCTGGTGASVVGFQGYDAATGGNPLFWGTCSLAVSANITPSFAPSALTVTLV